MSVIRETQLRSEYPRPQLVRADWKSLNGEWGFQFDDANMGLKEHWYDNSADGFDRRIIVPFCYQSKQSGIADTSYHDVVWYYRSFDLPVEFVGKHLILHFGAIDYESDVWVNGHHVFRHEGGHVPFSVDITDFVNDVANRVVVRAADFSKDLSLPRGKQYWKEQSASIFYTRTTGIWQSVWLEAVDEIHITNVRFTPDIDKQEIAVETFVSEVPEGQKVRVHVDVTFAGKPVKEATVDVPDKMIRTTLHLGESADRIGEGRLWSPEHPNLYHVTLTVEVDEQVTDKVDSYFGMRKIAVENGRVYLNNFPFYQKLVLDQGYFPDGILTAPSDDAIRRDVELVKEMGFNGVRKHQKVEDPRFLYWCDVLGLVVWGEMANSYVYSNEYVRRITSEWQAVIQRDYNHPCIIAWVPLNESWGVPNIGWSPEQQNHARAMYHLTKSLDSTRLVISNDGWEHVKSDLCTIHDYEWEREVLKTRYATEESAINASPAGRRIFVGGAMHEGQPIIVSEFGGIAFKKSNWEGWGYSGAASDEDFIERLQNVIEPLLDSPVVQGYCYTQFTDVEQEINGLLTYDRAAKVDLAVIRKMNESRR